MIEIEERIRKRVEELMAARREFVEQTNRTLYGMDVAIGELQAVLFIPEKTEPEVTDE